MTDNYKNLNILERMYSWWNESFKIYGRYSEDSLSNFFNRDIEMRFNSAVRSTSLKELSTRFSEVQRAYSFVENEVPFIQSFESADGRFLYTRHFVKFAENAKISCDLRCGWAEIKEGKISVLDLISINIS